MAISLPSTSILFLYFDSEFGRVLCHSISSSVPFSNTDVVSPFHSNRQADENGDGVLSYGEFSTIVRQIDATVTERAVKSMFREALLDSNSGSRILPASFEKVARAHGLAGNGHVHAKSHVAIAKACKHDDLALLKESWETVAPLIHEQVSAQGSGFTPEFGVYGLSR